MTSFLNSLLATILLMVVVTDASLGLEHHSPGGNISPDGFKRVQASVQTRKSRLFGCNGLDLGDVNVTCTHERLESRHGLGIDCTERVPLRTRAEFLSCPPGYNVMQEYTTITCKFPGNWDNEVFTCEETPTLAPTTTKQPTTINSTVARNTTTKPTTKKQANVTANSTLRAANTSTVSPTVAIAIATGNSSTNNTTLTNTTAEAASSKTAGNNSTTVVTATIPAGPVYENVAGVGVIKRGMKSLTHTEAVAECLRDGAVVMTVDTPARTTYANEYMNVTSTIFAGADNTYDMWSGLVGGPSGWRTSKGIPIVGTRLAMWSSQRPVDGTICAVWHKTAQAFWDLPPSSCNSVKLVYICEKS